MTPERERLIKNLKLSFPDKYDGRDDWDAFLRWGQSMLNYYRNTGVCGPSTEDLRVNALCSFVL